MSTTQEPRTKPAKRKLKGPICAGCGAAHEPHCCDECGRDMCAGCQPNAQLCAACDCWFCEDCVDKLFDKWECPDCGRRVHRACEMWFNCDQCGEQFCECQGAPLLLCENCDGACVCESCYHQSVGDEDWSLGACRECDLITRAEEALIRWKRTRRFEESTLSHAGTLLCDQMMRLINTTEVGDRIRHGRHGDLTRIAHNCVMAAAKSSSTKVRRTLLQGFLQFDGDTRDDVLRVLARRASPAQQRKLVEQSKRERWDEEGICVHPPDFVEWPPRNRRALAFCAEIEAGPRRRGTGPPRIRQARKPRRPSIFD